MSGLGKLLVVMALGAVAWLGLAVLLVPPVMAAFGVCP